MAVKAGYIYVLVHPSDPNLVKVGHTTRQPEIRLKEHNTQFEKAVGKVVQQTGELWVLQESFWVEDTYNAESAFWCSSPLWDSPVYRSKQEVMWIDGGYKSEVVREGIKAAKDAGIRDESNLPPLPKPKPSKGVDWFSSKLSPIGINPIDGYGNGMSKVWFRCNQNHEFKIDARSLCRFCSCPVCAPDAFDGYTLRRVEYGR